MSIPERALKHYLRQVKSVLPSRELKKRLMPQISQSICNYIVAHPEADMTMLQEHFGTPMQIAGSYLYEQETAALLRKLSIRKKILAIISGVLAAMIVIWLGFTTLATIVAHNYQPPYIFIDTQKNNSSTNYQYRR